MELRAREGLKGKRSAVIAGEEENMQELDGILNRERKRGKLVYPPRTPRLNETQGLRKMCELSTRDDFPVTDFAPPTEAETVAMVAHGK